MSVAVKTETIHYCVISHTHWDREWYQTFEQMRIRLVALIDNLLEILARDPDYIFHLDAQTIVLEDYLEIRPQRRGELERAIAAGRLLVGPWYVQNDLFLTSGESTVRNLLIGSALAARFGGGPLLGYVPDQFGLISQLPQIFNGFGITDCIFGRGYNGTITDDAGRPVRRPTVNEFEWRGEDGSAVLAIHMFNWYNNAQRFSSNRKRALKYLKLIDSQLRPASSTPYLLLMNGVDHLEAQEDLLPILADLNQQLDGATIHQVRLDDYIAKVRQALPAGPAHHHVGELRFGQDENILQNTLSSRAYLKQANVRAQSLLEHRIEPLYAMLACLGRPAAWPGDFLTYLWKMLIRTHPHDNICGCSGDGVHAHMEDLYVRLGECAGTLFNQGLKQLNDRINRDGLAESDYLLTVFNTLATGRSEVVTATLIFPADERVRAFELFDPAGQPVAFEVLGTRKKQFSTISPINLPGEITVDEFTIRFLCADLDGLAYRSYRVAPRRSGARLKTISKPAPTPAGAAIAIENEQLQLRVTPQGQVDLCHKASGVWTEDLLTLVDEADLGNAYMSRRAASDAPLDVSRQKPPKMTLLEATPLAQSVRLTYDARLPVGYNARRKHRAAKTELCRIMIECSLRAGSPRLDLEVSVDNRVKDHRLRLLVNTGLDTDCSLSSAPFDLVRRSRRLIQENACRDKCQPTGGLVALEDGRRSLTVFTEGVYEYEHLANERQSIALTLVRATGTIFSGADEPVPPSEWRTPGNQSLRRDRYRVAIMPGAPALAEVENRFREFLVPLANFHDSVNYQKFLGGRPCVQDSELTEIFYREIPEGETNLPREQQVLALDGPGVVLSAFKKAETQDLWVVRLFNTQPAAGRARLTFQQKVAGVWRLRLDETVGDPVRLDRNSLELELQPKQILTLAFRLGHD